MKQVRIADLKARLSEYRRALRVRKPAPGSLPPCRVKVPKRARLNVDIVELLLEERQGHR